MGSFKKICGQILILLIIHSLFPRNLFAESTDDVTRSLYLYTDYGLGTYKSKLLESNDTNSVLTYGAGIYAGTEKRLGVDYRVEQASTAFELNSSSLLLHWKTTAVRYRFPYVELGPVIGSVLAKGNRSGTDIFDAVGNGYGGFLGVLVPVGRRSTIDLKICQVSTSEIIDKNNAQVSIGPRLDLELSSRIGITKKNFDFTLGYRRRTFSITENSVSFAELQSATFIGFVGGFNF
ncbi:MAG: hypothetical protein NT027_06085 [Proteobacteria bacterium]|nr:hypothetical protein [Pseudomonadota bacterium]